MCDVCLCLVLWAFLNRLDVVEQRITHLEKMSTDTVQNEKGKKKKQKKVQYSTTAGTGHKVNIHLVEPRRRRKRREPTHGILPLKT